MRMLIGLCLAVVFVAATPHESEAQTPRPVAAAFVFDVAPAQFSAFMEIVPQVRAVVHKHDERAQMNVYNASFAGTAVERVVVITEFPSAQAWGAASEGLGTDPDYNRLVLEVAAMQGVELISRSLMTNVTP